METIKSVLMRRDGLTEAAAESLINDARKDLSNRLINSIMYGDPEDICRDWFGLEEDYLIELI
jgi:hypothetical protein